VSFSARLKAVPFHEATDAFFRNQPTEVYQSFVVRSFASAGTNFLTMTKPVDDRKKTAIGELF
jgi:hypothetical protein